MTTVKLDRPRLVDRLRAGRNRLFVGRDAELGLFAEALAGAPAAPSVLFLHGPGGVGKSALLRRMADDAAAAGRHVIVVDGRKVDCTPGGFEAAALPVFATDEPVLLVDTFERCRRLHDWFCDTFLPRLPAGAVVVVASREPPQLQWRTDPEWQDVLRVVALRGLPEEQARALLQRRGVAPGLVDRLLAFAGGHPLALSLAAEVAVRDRSWTTEGWTPAGGDVVRHLLGQLIGDVPTRAHRRALEVCAHALTTTESLLQATLPDEDAAELFDWLRGLPYVDSGRHGLFPHDVVREAMIADLRWRDTDGYLSMHLRMLEHVTEQVRSASPANVLQAAAELSFLHRGGPVSNYISWRGEGEVYEDRYRPADRDAVLRLARDREGVEGARIAGYWLDRRPEDFHVYRSGATGEVQAFCAWLQPVVTAEDRAADPVVAAAYRHCTQVAPLHEGERLAVVRFWEPARLLPPAVNDLVGWRVVAELLRTDGVAATYFVVFGSQSVPGMEFAGFYPGTTAAVGWRGHVDLYVHDWRVRPLRAWLQACAERDRLGLERLPAATADRLAVLTREEFTEAVRQALRSWGAAAELRASKLISSRLARRADDPVEALRGALAEAADALRADPRSVSQHRALVTTYFQGVRTQEAAAARLGMPFSTYRRHLARAVTAVADRLWLEETGGGASA